MNLLAAQQISVEFQQSETSIVLFLLLMNDFK